MASATFPAAAVLSPIWDTKFIETARPALSSAGELIFDPEDKRASDMLNAELDCSSNDAVDCADMFVFITILLTPSMSHPLRGVFYYTTSLP
jgi:hypothetical protein